MQKISAAPGCHQWTVRQAVSDRLMVLQAPVAILAHGSWEALPAERSVQRQARSGHELLAFKANFQQTSLAAGLLPVLAVAGGYGGMVLADQGVVTLACCIRADQLEVLRRSAPGQSAGAVSYTHLDVYKRQALSCNPLTCATAPPCCASTATSPVPLFTLYCRRRWLTMHPVAGGGCRPLARASVVMVRCCRWIDSAMMSVRSVEPELLDNLAAQDPAAQRSRRDLQRLHRAMGCLLYTSRCV